jgi:carboxylesterase type B
VFDSWGHAGGLTPDTEMQAVTRMAHGCWVSFAKNGRPEKCAPSGWPAYDPVKDQLMEFGASSGVRTNFRKPFLDAQEAAKAEVLSGK